MRREGRGSNVPTVYFITTNKGKEAEFRKLGETYGISVDFIREEKMEIQSTSLEAIATSALASAVHRHPRKLLAVEDAGLYIEALNGFPGPFSSYVFKTIGVGGLIKLMEGVKNRNAFFKSVIALWVPSQGIKLFTGVVEGKISDLPRGEGGFGFDPIFVPLGSELTFAEMSLEEKNRFSHRGLAFRRLAEWLRERFKFPQSLPLRGEEE